ncbi:hypothetical protein [Corynebacterium sphenisci]|uniref:hypothetical protein n=1 Tax=Corynebacterium sphenisci TaxID=191493 RepID=UPI0012F489F9|nr:hypothetical protein [Corynebacterium sphenisci]
MSWRNGKRGHVLVPCARCTRTKVHEARGLCKPCYNRLREGRIRGECLDDYPTVGCTAGWSSLADIARGGAAGHADELRRRLDPGHIPAREARMDILEVC